MTCQLSLYDEENRSPLLSLDTDDKMVFMNGKMCMLTQQEFCLLQALTEHANQPVSRELLLRDAWGYASPGETRTVDVHIQRLRKKLGFACIETIYKQGYRLRAQYV